MQNAPVGDDVFSEDPSVNELERLAAQMFGKDAGLFCPSGTMSNQIAIKAQTQPGDEVICEAGAHIYYYEGGGIAFNSGCTTKTLTGERGVFTAAQLQNALRPSNVHFPSTSLVSIENTCNRGGGKVFDLQEIRNIHFVCKSNNLKLHLDGARLFNALVASKNEPEHIGEYFDSISICLSKGLGAPVGSILIGNEELIAKARRIRKVLGGGMRQAGVIASAGIFALQNHVDRLVQDHELATSIESLLEKCPFVLKVLPVETNIVVFDLIPNIDATDFLKHLESNQILALQVGPQQIRFVTHMDLPESTLKKIESALNSFRSNY